MKAGTGCISGRPVPQPTTVSKLVPGIQCPLLSSLGSSIQEVHRLRYKQNIHMQKIKSNINVQSKRKQKRKEREGETPRKQAVDTIRPRWVAHLFPSLIWGRPPGSPGSQRELRCESWLHQTTFLNVILEDTALGLSLEILQVSVSRTTMKRNTLHPERSHLARTQREAL